jgi:hypothetical protein
LLGIGEPVKYLTHLKDLNFVLALLPLARLLYGAVTDSPGANPIEYITR